VKGLANGINTPPRSDRQCIPVRLLPIEKHWLEAFAGRLNCSQNEVVRVALRHLVQTVRKGEGVYMTLPADHGQREG
jgi:hypothetical protein